MRSIEFLDTTLRDGEQTPGVNLSIKEKVAIAKQLERWGIASIEAGFPAASPDSFEAVRQIAQVMTKTAVSGLARSVKSDKRCEIPTMPRFHCDQSYSPRIQTEKI